MQISKGTWWSEELALGMRIRDKQSFGVELLLHNLLSTSRICVIDMVTHDKNIQNYFDNLNCTSTWSHGATSHELERHSGMEQ